MHKVVSEIFYYKLFFLVWFIYCFSPDIPAAVGGAVEEAVVAGGLGEDVPGDGGLAEAQAAVGAGGQPVLHCTVLHLYCTVLYLFLHSPHTA